MSSLMFRTSVGSAFIPTIPYQLNEPNCYMTNYADPRFPSEGPYPVNQCSYYNPELQPYSTRTVNAGLVFQPLAGPLKGLRLNAERVRYSSSNAHFQFNSLSDIPLIEEHFPGAVQRDASGRVTQAQLGPFNGSKNAQAYWDFAGSYQKALSSGHSIIMSANATLFDYILTQPAYGAPLINQALSPGYMKKKGNASLGYEANHWSLTWSTLFVGSHAIDPYYAGMIGYDRIPTQIVHTLSGNYRVPDSAPGGRMGKILEGMSFTLAVRNVFDTWPELDMGYDFYASPHVSKDLRTLSLTMQKRF